MIPNAAQYFPLLTTTTITVLIYQARNRSNLYLHPSIHLYISTLKPSFGHDKLRGTGTNHLKNLQANPHRSEDGHWQVFQFLRHLNSCQRPTFSSNAKTTRCSANDFVNHDDALRVNPPSGSLSGSIKKDGLLR